jgi:NAD(P)-dependent dehydrogenase (short-subunit alcohol dehydrogenase family)
MTALAADALAGIAVAVAPNAAAEETGAAATLTDGLIALGANLVTDEGPVDLAVVAIDGVGRRSNPDEPQPVAARALDASYPRPVTAPPLDDADPQPVAAPSLDAAADGTLAAGLTEAFAAARDAFPRLRPGGCLLFVLADASADHADTDPARAAIGSLTGTLALEWAPGRRVNALICARPEDAIEVAALIAWPASRTLTGAVLDLAG